MMRGCAGAVIAALASLTITSALPPPARADQVWSVGSGRVVFNFNVPMLRDLGIDLTVAGNPVPEQVDLLLEAPRWAFPIRAGSDFRFRTEHGVALPEGSLGGALDLAAGLTMRDRASGTVSRLTDLEIVQAPWPGGEATAAEDGPPLVLRSRSSGRVFCRLVSSMFDFRPKDHALRIHYLNARLTREWAESFGRPELADRVIGLGEVRGEARMLSSAPATSAPHRPVFEGGFKDVSLGALSGIQQEGHVGVFPNGTTALSMSTTSCNVGTVDVPWLAPMQTDHPVIAMALYRLLGGRFEQIGISWLKHGFFATSSSLCTTCEDPSNGTYLAIGCSDTYGVGNNRDRLFLGPRSEVNPYTGIWTCVGSHFSGGVEDCTRRHGSREHDAVEHRLIAADADLGNAGASYYYEAHYIVRGDEDLHNNWGSRACTITSSGSSWAFSTPNSGNDLLAGPALERWGELRTTVDVGSDDGQVLLAVQTTALGGGSYHYEYALLNLHSERRIRSFELPVVGVRNIRNLGFHDSNANASDDWQVSVDAAAIRWETETFAANPEAAALEFGTLVNFRFDADAVPADLGAVLGIFKPGTGSEVTATTRGPINAPTAVGDPNLPRIPRLLGLRPNPTRRGAVISYELPGAVLVRLSIHDATGRQVRTLVNEPRDPGVHSTAWDGTIAGGARVPAGVYYASLQAGTTTAARPIVIVN